MRNEIRSPLSYVGGKYYSRDRILCAFPSSTSYTTYCEPFVGACHIILAKRPYNHLEIINDANKDLVNFWMQCRNHPEELQHLIDTLPYARSLYDDWQISLFDNTPIDDMERAVRWFYVLRSAIGGIIRQSKGNWGYQVAMDNTAKLQAFSMHRATSLFTALSTRLANVQIECRDFEKIITTYGRSSTFFYCDPPYIDAEFYYEGVPPFTMRDHERLAHVLNTTSAQVAVSYYPHEALNTLYPAHKWRRITWDVYKNAERTQGKRQVAQEMLLMNYQPSRPSLWDEEEVSA